VVLGVAVVEVGIQMDLQQLPIGEDIAIIFQLIVFYLLALSSPKDEVNLLPLCPHNLTNKLWRIQELPQTILFLARVLPGPETQFVGEIADEECVLVFLERVIGKIGVVILKENPTKYPYKLFHCYTRLPINYATPDPPVLAAALPPKTAVVEGNDRPRFPLAAMEHLTDIIYMRFRSIVVVVELVVGVVKPLTVLEVGGECPHTKHHNSILTIILRL
jgi:hypothetical protein